MCDITSTLWFLVLAVIVKGEIFSFNEEMDGFFSQFRDDIRLANNSQFPLPNIHAVFTKDILFLSLPGEMNGTEGTVGDMETIKRTSNVTVVTSKKNFVFRAEFGFDDLKVAYKYEAKFMGIPLKGNLELSVGDNSIYIELLVNLTQNRCSGNVITVRNLRITALKDISVRVTGFSLVNSLMGYLLTKSFKDVSTSVTNPIEDGLRSFFRENIKHFDFCKFGSVPQNIPFDDVASSEDLSGNVQDNVNDSHKEVKVNTV